MPMYEFQCPQGHISEALVPPHVQDIVCPAPECQPRNMSDMSKLESWKPRDLVIVKAHRIMSASNTTFRHADRSPIKRQRGSVDVLAWAIVALIMGAMAVAIYGEDMQDAEFQREPMKACALDIVLYAQSVDACLKASACIVTVREMRYRRDIVERYPQCFLPDAERKP